VGLQATYATCRYLERSDPCRDISWGAAVGPLDGAPDQADVDFVYFDEGDLGNPSIRPRVEELERAGFRRLAPLRPEGWLLLGRGALREPRG
jgi:hypothetical protein